MEGLEEICFLIISQSGQAKALLMEAVARSKADDSDANETQELIDQAREALKGAQTEHLKVLSNFAETGENVINPLYMHAEDQMMSAEIFLDFSVELVSTNQELKALKNKNA